MNDIFTNLYNKVLGFFRKVEAPEENSKDIACNRLRVVLMQDRTNLTPELLERMRSELVELLSKYLEMDKDALELNLEQDGEQMALALSIPVIRAKDEEEIEAAIKAEKEVKEEESSQDKIKDNEDKEDSEEEEVQESESEDDCSEDNTEDAKDPIDEEPEKNEEQESDSTDKDVKQKRK